MASFEKFENVVFDYLKDGRVLLMLRRLDSWEDFDSLIDFLKDFYDAKVSLSADGPGARRWILDISGFTVEVLFDDLGGIDILSTNAEGFELIKKIGMDLNERIS